MQLYNLQAQPIQQLELQCVKLLLRTEQVRLAVSRVGTQYRAFFGWLLRLVRSLESDDVAQEGAAGAAADISAFLEGQFVADAVEPQLNVGSCCGDGIGECLCCWWRLANVLST